MTRRTDEAADRHALIDNMADTQTQRDLQAIELEHGSDAAAAYREKMEAPVDLSSCCGARAKFIDNAICCLKCFEECDIAAPATQPTRWKYFADAVNSMGLEFSYTDVVTATDSIEALKIGRAAFRELNPGAELIGSTVEVI